MKLLSTLLLGTAAFTLQAATTIDLTTAGATNGPGGTAAAIGGNFIVQQITPQSTGTGVIDSFLRVQSNTTEQGYNTSTGTPYDDKAGNFTRALQLGEVPTVTLGGVVYRQFLLDINQTGPNPLINLNQIEILQASSDLPCPSPATTCGTTVSGTYPTLTAPAGTTVAFQMSAPTSGTQSTILLDFSLNSGSGSGDMFLYVRNSAFANQSPTSNVILFTQFGNPPGGNATNDGFEEWAVLKAAGSTCVGDCTVNAPEPSSFVLFGVVMIGAVQLLRKRASVSRA